MKRLKNGVNCAYKEKENIIKSTLLNDLKGYSLLELLISVAIGAISSLTLATLFVFVMTQFVIMVEKNTAQEHALLISYYLRSSLSNAVDIRRAAEGAGVFLGNIGGTPVRFGRFDADFDMDNLASGVTVPLAFFPREDGSFAFSNDADNIADGSFSGPVIRPTGIFVRAPDMATPFVERDSYIRGISGEIYFDNGFNGGVAATDSGLRYDRLSGLRIVNSETQTYKGIAKMKTARIEIRVRYPKIADIHTWDFRRPTDIANYPHREIVKTIEIGFRNNVLADQSLTGGEDKPERLHGSIYYYKTFIPRMDF